MIYLIHIDPPVGKAAHYLGFCRDGRLERRLIEHARGLGASLTRAAIQRSSKLYLARTFPDLDYTHEKIMKRHGSYKLMCTLCCPVLHMLKSATYQIDDNRPEQPPTRAVLDWRTPSAPNET